MKYLIRSMLLFLFLVNAVVAATYELPLQVKVNTFINNLNLPHDCTVAISAHQLDVNNQIIDTGSFNAEKILYTASISKLLILLAVMHEVNLGNIILDQPVILFNPDEIISSEISVHFVLDRMIKDSSNYYAGVAQRLLSFDNYQGKIYTGDVAQKYGFGKGIFWAGKGYENGESYPGILYNHEGTANSINQFYLQLARNTLPQSSAMLKVLSGSSINDRFYKALRARNIAPQNIFRKSGSWTGNGTYSDTAWVKLEDKSLILTLLTQGNACIDRGSKGWHEKFISSLNI